MADQKNTVIPFPGQLPLGSRPQDRIHKRKIKTPSRLVSMQLPLDLIAAIERMAIGNQRKFHNQIICALKWAAWAHNNGHNIEDDMGRLARGWSSWDSDLWESKTDKIQ